MTKSEPRKPSIQSSHAHSIKGLHAWLITDQKKGHYLQAEAIAQKLGLTYESYTLKNMPPWRRKTPCPLLPFDLIPTEKVHKSPQILISAGGMGLLAQRKLFTQQKNAFRVHIMQRPRKDKLLDAHILMRHDLPSEYKTKPNEFLATLPPTNISIHQATLQKEVILPYWEDTRKIGFLLGGPNKSLRFSPNDAHGLGKRLSEIIKACHGSLYISPSRRTPLNSLHALCRSLDIPYYCWDQCSANPHQHIIRQADTLLVSQDSISMQSDALHAGKPLYILPMKTKLFSAKMNKYQKFSDELVVSKKAKYLTSSLSPYPQTPTEEIQRIAQFIEQQYFQKTM